MQPLVGQRLALLLVKSDTPHTASLDWLVCECAAPRRCHSTSPCRSAACSGRPLQPKQGSKGPPSYLPRVRTQTLGKAIAKVVRHVRGIVAENPTSRLVRSHPNPDLNHDLMLPNDQVHRARATALEATKRLRGAGSGATASSMAH